MRRLPQSSRSRDRLWSSPCSQPPASAGLYIAASVAAWLLARRNVALAGVPLNFRWLRVAMGLGVGTMLLLIAVASPVEITGLSALAAGSAAVHLLQSRIVARSAT